MKNITPVIKVQDIDHTGIVAGIIDQIGLVHPGGNNPPVTHNL